MFGIDSHLDAVCFLEGINRELKCNIDCSVCGLLHLGVLHKEICVATIDEFA